ncbi:MAG: hypothetical protein AAF065_13925 [Verrucomicrobiota bacterium]
MMNKLKNYMTLILCAVYLLTVIGFTAERYFLIQSITDQKQYEYLVIDESCFYLPKSFTFEEAHGLHFDQAQLACETLLNRGPGGIDSQDRLKHLFHPEALPKAKQIIDGEAVDFKNRSIHQKVSIAEIRQLKMKNDSVLILVTGQLIRTGEFMNKIFVEALDFECQLHFVLNRSMLQNGRYPTIVYNFNLKTKAIPSV